MAERRLVNNRESWQALVTKRSADDSWRSGAAVSQSDGRWRVSLHRQQLGRRSRSEHASRRQEANHSTGEIFKPTTIQVKYLSQPQSR